MIRFVTVPSPLAKPLMQDTKKPRLAGLREMVLHSTECYTAPKAGKI